MQMLNPVISLAVHAAVALKPRYFEAAVDARVDKPPHNAIPSTDRVEIKSREH